MFSVFESDWFVLGAEVDSGAVMDTSLFRDFLHSLNSSSPAKLNLYFLFTPSGDVKPTVIAFCMNDRSIRIDAFRGKAQYLAALAPVRTMTTSFTPSAVPVMIHGASLERLNSRMGGSKKRSWPWRWMRRFGSRFGMRKIRG